MTTGTILVTDALTFAGIVPPAGTVQANDLTFGLRSLNRMLDEWANIKAMLFTNATESFSLVAGTASYTTASLSSGRPVGIAYMFVRLSNVDYPVELVDIETFDDIGYKTAQGTPEVCHYDNAYPTATFNFFPVPYAAFTCYVETQRVLTGTIAAATDVLLPPGYEKAIVDNLGIYLGTAYGMSPTPEKLSQAMESRKVLKRQNYEALVSDIGWNNNQINSTYPTFPY